MLRRGQEQKTLVEKELRLLVPIWYKKEPKASHNNKKKNKQQNAMKPKKAAVTPDLRDKVGCVSYVHQIRTSHIMTKCIEINVIKHQSTYYIAEDLLQNK